MYLIILDASFVYLILQFFLEEYFSSEVAPFSKTQLLLMDFIVLGVWVRNVNLELNYLHPWFL